MEQQLLQAVAQTVKNEYEVTPDKITPLGGGFYGRAYFVELDATPYQIVFKVYLFDHLTGLATQEAALLELLKDHGTIPVPEVFFEQKRSKEIPFDILAMEYIPGINAGIQRDLTEEMLDTLGEQIVTNLMSYHNAEHEEGFGLATAETFSSEWNEFYATVAKENYDKGKILFDKGSLPIETWQAMDRAYQNFEQVFYLPIEKPGLVHGDYNPWNVLITPNRRGTAAVVNPIGGCWGDPELDLHQLGNANGKEYQLLQRYIRRQGISENFALKNSFYHVFTEVGHHHDTGRDIDQGLILQQGYDLTKQLNHFGIPG